MEPHAGWRMEDRIILEVEHLLVVTIDRCGCFRIVLGLGCTSAHLVNQALALGLSLSNAPTKTRQ